MVDKMPFFSIVIPTYNREKHISKAIESVLAQSFKDYEILVIDDGSTDRTSDILKVHNNAIKYIRINNQGVSEARNTGIRHARGEWIAFLDSDDEWEPDKLLLTSYDISYNPNIIAHIGNVLLVKVDGTSTNYFEHRNCLCKYGMYCNIEEPFCHVLENQIFLSGLAAKKSIVAKNGEFDRMLNFMEDYDWCLRLAKHGVWGKTDILLARVIRRDEPTKALSMIPRVDQLQILQSILKRWLRDNRLTGNEQKQLKRFLSFVLFDLGVQQEILCRSRESRATLAESLLHNRSIRLLSKYIALSMFGIDIYRMLHKYSTANDRSIR